MEKFLYKAKRKLNGKWVFGSLIQIGNDWCQIIPENTEYDDIDQNMFRVISDTVGLFSGEKDIDDKNIFSGDIVEYFRFVSDKKPTIGVIILKDACFQIEPSTCIRHSLLIDFMRNIKVIGNIHDNPELLVFS